MIKAEIETTDGLVQTEFDASSYFAQAHFDKIDSIIDEGLEGNPGSALNDLFIFYAKSATRAAYLHWAQHEGQRDDRYLQRDPHESRINGTRVDWVIRIDPVTLRNWLIENDFGYLIGKVPEPVATKSPSP